MKETHQIWKFFSSVKLAIFTLCAISLTSIIGTVIPQGRESSYYVEAYGQTIAKFFQVLDIPEMYGSWWFLALLVLLAVNLIICSIDRFPQAWKQITLDQTSLKRDKIEKMAFIHSFENAPKEMAEELIASLRQRGWKVDSKESAEGIVTAAQKGGWSRIGVYIVHLSILVIFAGAIIGNLLGFKGSVLIPETKDTDKVYATGTQQPIDLGFTVRCDRFDIEFYDNGMPKEYRSRLVVSENGKEVMVKDIEVNDPLQYRGFTFYQSSYEGYRDFIVTLAGSGQTRTLVAPFQQQVSLDEQKISMGVVNAEAVRERVVRIKFWLKAGDNPPATFWIEPLQATPLEQYGVQQTLTVKQMYATGLQVAKDPGVWIVYLGCLMMMVGLYVAFFLSHTRIWLVTTSGRENSLLLAGTTNKNRIGFEKTFNGLIDLCQSSRD